MFLAEPEPSAERHALYEDDLEDVGYVMNFTRTWAWAPAVLGGVFAAMDEAAAVGGISFRDKGILVTATARALGDSYCTLAWGNRLSSAADVTTAVALARGDAPTSLDQREMELAAWAGKVAADPNATTQADIDRLRAAGFSEPEIVGMTAYIALRLAFSTVNDALGAAPDAELVAAVPPELVAAVDFGRRPASRVVPDAER